MVPTVLDCCDRNKSLISHACIMAFVNCNGGVSRRGPNVAIPALYCAMKSVPLLKFVLFVKKLIRQSKRR